VKPSHRVCSTSWRTVRGPENTTITLSSRTRLGARCWCSTRTRAHSGPWTFHKSRRDTKRRRGTYCSWCCCGRQTARHGCTPRLCPVAKCLLLTSSTSIGVHWIVPSQRLSRRDTNRTGSQCSVRTPGVACTSGGQPKTRYGRGTPTMGHFIRPASNWCPRARTVEPRCTLPPDTVALFMCSGIILPTTYATTPVRWVLTASYSLWSRYPHPIKSCRLPLCHPKQMVARVCWLTDNPITIHFCIFVFHFSLFCRIFFFPIWFNNNDILIDFIEFMNRRYNWSIFSTTLRLNTLCM